MKRRDLLKMFAVVVVWPVRRMRVDLGTGNVQTIACDADGGILVPRELTAAVLRAKKRGWGCITNEMLEDAHAMKLPELCPEIDIE